MFSIVCLGKDRIIWLGYETPNKGSHYLMINIAPQISSGDAKLSWAKHDKAL